MSDERINAEHENDTRKSRIFGLRAAALAGIVVSASAVTIGFSGTLDDVSGGVANTTCCPPEHSVME